MRTAGDHNMKHSNPFIGAASAMLHEARKNALIGKPGPNHLNGGGEERPSSLCGPGVVVPGLLKWMENSLGSNSFWFEKMLNR